MQEITDKVRQKMDKHLERLTSDLGSVRAGKASVLLLDRVKVDYYGTMTPISQIGSLGTQDSRTITIQPWEAGLVPAIEKAIRNADLGLNPVNDGKIIRLSVPQLTEERRKELVKTVKKLGEDAKINVRNARRDGNEELKKLKKNGEMSEDDVKKRQDNVQKITDQFIKKIDETITKKEADIMEI